MEGGLDMCACVDKVAILVGCRCAFLVQRRISWRNCIEVLCLASKEEHI